ncbi:091R [Invertebrate iridescent virus Kaz2018]|uniref:091R n=1 Tax=Invertebrate iridescent virus 6 TaxID=176652 RepID=Q91G23_IIV6|nr:091R [Invertebrate iridescent virus 6]AAK82009.1 091R [Invertebrate iridescent virus 6]QMS79507.1 hypothetical protein IIV6-T1_095 [Invertebrate iridescent virus 6]QNH08501.1 091R [Invertebrate iridescent virus Kaz2018]
MEAMCLVVLMHLQVLSWFVRQDMLTILFCLHTTITEVSRILYRFHHHKRIHEYMDI